MKKWISVLFFISGAASAATIEDVRILDIKQGPENVELKLQSKAGAPGSYFYVDIVKEDTGSFEKLAHVITKLVQRESHRLDLEIPSFSASPNGSYYRGERVLFIAKPVKKSNKGK